MDQYYQILSSCRIPGPKRDTVVNYATGKIPSTHITVVHNFQVRYSSFSDINSILVLWLKQPGGLFAVLCLRCVQQRRHPTDSGPVTHAAGEDLELLVADEQGAYRHSDLTAPQHLGESLQQPD